MRGNQQPAVHIRQVTPFHIAHYHIIFLQLITEQKQEVMFEGCEQEGRMDLSNTTFMFDVESNRIAHQPSGNFIPYLSRYHLLSDKSMGKSNLSLMHLMQLNAFEH